MFEAERAIAAERLQEVRVLHQFIASEESPDPLVSDSNRALVLRGLFFVQLYAYFESSINQLISAVLNNISDRGVGTCYLERVLYSIALHSKLTAVENSGAGSRLKRRVELFRSQGVTNSCKIDDSALASYLQNVWAATLDQVLDCLGIDKSAVPSGRHRGYLDELVEKRNAVSHGRTSAIDVGRRYRSPELLARLDAISEIVAHLETVMEGYLCDREYIDAMHRGTYTLTAGVP